jgi:hypothetical protein
MDGTAVTVTGAWLDGSEPGAMAVSWVNLDTYGSQHFEGGTGTLYLEPGPYHLVTMLTQSFDAPQYVEVFSHAPGTLEGA